MTFRPQVSMGYAVALGSAGLVAAPLLWAMLGGLLLWNLFFSGLSWLILAPSSGVPTGYIFTIMPDCPVFLLSRGCIFILTL